MASKIKVLSDQTINQIAAGEVIENPASVVKELIENALDAGAMRIFIETRGGGLHTILVSDDGCGMQSDDALLCFERHATSKIRLLDDLNSLSTLGFRGEALPSIAAISKLSLLTATEGVTGTHVEIEGGKILQVSPGARSRGTTIEVQGLFFNVPARKKFQKSASICEAEIVKLLSQLALAHPKVAFELLQNGREVFKIEKTEQFGERIKQILGEELYRSLLPIERKEKNRGLFGFIGDPLQTRPNRTGQYLIMNSRPVVCFAVSAALRDSYATRIAPNRHPIFILHLDLTGDLVDVNVHPQKREVRFREEEKLKEWIREQVGNALQKSESPIFSFPPNLSADLSPRNGSVDFSFFPEKTSLREDIPTYSNNLIRDFVQPLGIFQRFFFLNDGDALIIVDLSAAEARLIFDALISGDFIAKQGLAIPQILSFSSAETAVIEMHLEVFESLGFSIHSSGKNCFLIDAIPACCEVSELTELFHRFCEELSGLGSIELGKQKIAMLTSRLGKAGKTHFMLEEGLAVWNKIKTLSSKFCPQGRPIWKKVDSNAIEKWIKN